MPRRSSARVAGVLGRTREFGGFVVRGVPVRETLVHKDAEQNWAPMILMSLRRRLRAVVRTW
jgi:hypothetical protein